MACWCVTLKKRMKDCCASYNITYLILNLNSFGNILFGLLQSLFDAVTYANRKDTVTFSKGVRPDDKKRQW